KFRREWESAESSRSAAIQQHLIDSHELSEPAVAFFLSQACPPDNGLFVGNSMPIRDFDWFGVSLNDQVRLVAANRGASGIDGLMATASGYALGLQRPTTIVIGDLSTLHDLNSLSLIANSPFPLTVVIINNHGGHIFDILPVSRSDHFEKYFATPHSWKFEHAAEMFGLPYRKMTEMKDFKEHYIESLSSDRSNVMELMTDRSCNTRVRRLVREEIRQCRNAI
ncbi:MAG: thiamine pyrophosphate-binding protein, partial [Planctomycetota bacterium]